MEPTATLGSFDPLSLDVALPLEGTFYPLGFAVEIATNSHEVLQAAEESWSEWAQSFDAPPVRIRIAISEDDAGSSVPLPVYRAQGHLLAVIADSSNFGVCDLNAGFAFCWITPRAAAEHGYFRYHYLEGIVYCALEHLHSVGLHAGCVALDGKGVMLWGEPGAGKTCLSFACARKGWTFVADDAIQLLRTRTDRTVLGMPYVVRFRPSAANLFPELAGRPTLIRASGVPFVEMRTAALPNIRTAGTARIDHIVFLDRRAGFASELRGVSKREALERIESAVACCETPIFEKKRASLRALMEATTHVLTYSDPDSATDKLELLVRGERAIDLGRGGGNL